ncbi:MAG: hypothetical protein QOK44_5502, partial [Betaproteobacteria bacterium]|nr:hypothetical protein [Betaproteobacteria bacterium]
EYTPHPTQLGTAERFAAVLDAHGLTNGLLVGAGPWFRQPVTDPFIHAAIDAFTLDRCVWGSDWPWVRMDERMDYGPVYGCLERWLPDPEDRQKVLWDTPARLFGFK